MFFFVVVGTAERPDRVVHRSLASDRNPLKLARGAFPERREGY